MYFPFITWKSWYGNCTNINNDTLGYALSKLVEGTNVRIVTEFDTIETYRRKGLFR